MTTEQTHETGKPSVKITTNAKGYAQVEVKVYGAPYGKDFAVNASTGEVVVTPTSLEELGSIMDELTTVAATAKASLEAKIRGNDGKVAGDE